MMKYLNVFREFPRSMTCFRGLLLAALFMSPAALPADQDKAIYWSIMKGEQQAGYLLGTIHSEDPRVLDFPELLLKQLQSSQVFAMELVPDLPTLQKLTEYMHYQDGTILENQVGSERFGKIRKLLLSNFQVPADWLNTMKVWAVVMTLSIPAPETGLFMDFSLSLRASGSGLRVVGLETLEQQLSFLEEMPTAQQLELLDQALEDYDQVAVLHQQMVESYLGGDLQELKKDAVEQMGRLTDEARDYFIRHGIDERNHRMLESLLPLLAKSPVFVAVGALHLPGEQGLVTLLREAGYVLRPEPLPLGDPLQ